MGQIQSYYRILGLEANANATQIQDAIDKMRAIDTEGNYTAILNKIEKALLPRSFQKNVKPVQILDPVPTRPTSHAATTRDDDLMFAVPDELTLGDSRNDAPAVHDAPAVQSHRSAFAHDMEVEHSELQHNDDMPQGDGFLDFGENQYLTAPQRKRNTPVQDHRKFITPEEIQAYNRPPSVWAKIFSGRNLVLAILAVALLVGGAIASLPLYNIYQSKQQSDAGFAALSAARKDVDSLIRQKGFFPDALPAGRDQSEYTLSLDPQAEKLTLTFTAQAAESLRGHALIMSSYNVPNLGLQWRCDISAAYPANFRPAQCF